MKSSPKLRILMTTDAVGGVWSYTTALATALVERSCEVLVVTLGPRPRPDQVASIAGHSALKLVVTDHALEWMDPQGRDFDRACDRLTKIAREFKPDLMHFNSYREATVGWEIPVLVVAHSCVWTWWQACCGSSPEEPCWSIYADRVRSAIDLADCWIAPSEAFRLAIERTYCPRNHGRVVYNGIEELPHAIGKEHFILAAGRLWDEAKNIAALARIASDLDWPVKLVGPESQEHDGIAGTECAEFLGRLPRQDLLSLMARASIYAAPSLYEPFGLSVLEAASSGCALLLSDIPAYRELWRGAALFVDPRDDRELGRTLRLLCEDQDFREKLQRAARRRARRYSRKAMSVGYLAAYRSLLEPQAIVMPPHSAPDARNFGP